MTFTAPLVARASPAAIEMSVVLPAPFGPSRAKNSPFSIRSETPLSACRDPYRLVTESISMAAAMPLPILPALASRLSPLAAKAKPRKRKPPKPRGLRRRLFPTRPCLSGHGAGSEEQLVHPVELRKLAQLDRRAG